jgi:DNA-3-methyladenine glycosylase II
MTPRDRALRYLKRIDPRLYEATKAARDRLPDTLPAKRTRAELFSALVSIVVSQQLGLAAADSIFMRVREACDGAITPPAILRLSEMELRAVGLSGAKVKTIKAIADAVTENDKEKALDLISLKRVPEEIAHEKLTAIWGLGPWSVEMFMIFALGREDVFSPGDLGLLRSIERIYGLPKNTPRSSLLAISEKWAPYRTWACLLLWRSKDNAPLPGKIKGRHR